MVVSVGGLSNEFATPVKTGAVCGSPGAHASVPLLFNQCPLEQDAHEYTISPDSSGQFPHCSSRPLAAVVARLKGADAKVGDATFPDARASTENTATVSRRLVRTRAPGGGHCALCQSSDDRPGWRHEFYFEHTLLASKTLHACADCDRIFRDDASYLASKCRLC